jgi:hypothetical protein
MQSDKTKKERALSVAVAIGVRSVSHLKACGLSGFLNPQARNVRSHCRFLDGLFQWPQKRPPLSRSLKYWQLFIFLVSLLPYTGSLIQFKPFNIGKAMIPKSTLHQML